MIFVCIGELACMYVPPRVCACLRVYVRAKCDDLSRAENESVSDYRQMKSTRQKEHLISPSTIDHQAHAVCWAGAERTSDLTITQAHAVGWAGAERSDLTVNKPNKI